MKQGRYKIVGGPNWAFYVFTGFALWMSYVYKSLAPALIWLAICLVFVPISIYLHRWTEEQERKIAEEFPDDPVIQKKYGKNHLAQRQDRAIK
jgi:hypothetical protein